METCLCDWECAYEQEKWEEERKKWMMPKCQSQRKQNCLQMANESRLGRQRRRKKTAKKQQQQHTKSIESFILAQEADSTHLFSKWRIEQRTSEKTEMDVNHISYISWALDTHTHTHIYTHGHVVIKCCMGFVGNRKNHRKPTAIEFELLQGKFLISLRTNFSLLIACASASVNHHAYTSI